jgi:hypothetical protein
MPRFVARIVTAAGRRYQLANFSSVNTDQRLVSSDQLQLPNRRTKLLTPSVASVGIQAPVNYNDRVLRYAGRNPASISYFTYPQEFSIL